MAGFIGNVPAEKYTALQRQTFSSPTGTSHTLSYSVTNSDDLLLYINNVKQDPADYSASGTSLTTPTLVSGDEMYALFYGRATETVNPPDNSVGNSAMADDAIGLAELSATGTASSSTFLRGDNSWATPTSGADTDLSNLSATGENKVAQAWVAFNGSGTLAVLDSGGHTGVSSVTDNGTGDYSVTLSSALGNANYAIAGSVTCTTGASGQRALEISSTNLPTTTVVRLFTSYVHATTNRTKVDEVHISIIIFGD